MSSGAPSSFPPVSAGLRVESALAEALVAEIGDEPGGLPLLSTALVGPVDGAQRRLARGGARRLGGVRGAVARLADSSYNNLSTTNAPPPAGCSCDWPAPARREPSRGGGSALELDLERDPCSPRSSSA